LTQGVTDSISDGRQITAAFDNINGGSLVFFFTEHATNTGNTILTVCGEQVGLTGTDMLATNVGVRVETLDFYYGGPGDEVSDIVVTPLGEQYFATVEDILAGEEAEFEVTDFGVFPGNTPEEGLLLITNRSRTGNTGGATPGTEALIFAPK